MRTTYFAVALTVVVLWGIANASQYIASLGG
jgi:hypothetical protein